VDRSSLAGIAGDRRGPGGGACWGRAGDGGEYAELFFEHRSTLHLALEDGRVRSVGAGIDGGVGIRVFAGGAVGFAYAESFEAGPMLAAARTAARVAKARGPGRAARGGRRVASSPAQVPTPVHMSVAPEAAAALLRRVDRAARAADPAIVRVEASLAVVRREILVTSSDGPMLRDVQPLLRLSVAAIAERGGRREAGSAGGGGRVGLEYFTTRTPESFAREAARIAVVNLDARAAPAGTLPVVLAPGDAGIWLHEAVGHGLEADFIRKRSSSYSGREGQRVASPRGDAVRRRERARRARQPGGRRRGRGADATPVDRSRGAARAPARPPERARGRRGSERGRPAPELPRRAAAADEQHLAGARRGRPGDIIRSVKLGVYAARFSGGQVNIASGDFVFGLTEGYLIEDGRITAPLRGVHLIGNGPAALAAVSMVGPDLEMSEATWTCTKESQNVPVGVGMPTVKIDRLTIGGTALTEEPR
jgi:TldD protein